MPSKIADTLPEFVSFLKQLSLDVKSEKITSWADFEASTNVFYTVDMMNKIETIAPGWIEMASYRDGITVTHVTAVFVALFLSPEYQSATEQQKILMQWAVLFHDITKIPVKGSHDYIHPYKSAALAGKTLMNLNFPTNASPTEIDNWCKLTTGAIFYSEEHCETIQDSDKLSQIIEGLKKIYDRDASAIILAVLLHFSITTHLEYPSLSPIRDEHIEQYITDYDFPIIRGLMLADGNAWHLFDEDKIADKQRRDYAQNAFKRVGALIKI